MGLPSQFNIVNQEPIGKLSIDLYIIYLLVNQHYYSTLTHFFMDLHFLEFLDITSMTDWSSKWDPYQMAQL